MDVSKNRYSTPKMDGLFHGKTLLKWMICGYPYFWKHPYRTLKDVLPFHPIILSIHVELSYCVATLEDVFLFFSGRVGITPGSFDHHLIRKKNPCSLLRYCLKTRTTWMSQELSKRLGSVGHNPLP